MYYITSYNVEWLRYNELETKWKEIGCGLIQATITALIWRGLETPQKNWGQSVFRPTFQPNTPRYRSQLDWRDTFYVFTTVHWRIRNSLHNSRGRDGSVGIATRYGLDGPGIESRWGGGEIFRTRTDRHWGTPSLLYNGYRVFPVGKAAGAWRWPPPPI